MIKHLLKMVWNRKRINFLITVEIFVSFIVLFAVIGVAVYYLTNYLQPLGFDYENVWAIEITTHIDNSQKHPEAPTLYRQLIPALLEFGEVEAAAACDITPYSYSNSNVGRNVNGHQISYSTDTASDGFNDVARLTLTRGRWFSKEDDGKEWQPVVINELLGRELFGNSDPLGKSISPPNSKPEQRVVGVIIDFRKNGEFAVPTSFLFQRHNLSDPKDQIAQNIMIRVRPGTTAAVEEKIIEKFHAMAPDWSFKIKPISEMRRSMNTLRLAPVIAVCLIAGFLMIMVALGLTGVLWQNVTQRTREIGLRRAKGATAGRIYQQILGELVIITSCGVILAVIVIIQFPLLNVIGFVSARVYGYSMLFSFIIIYLLTIVCGLYPSMLATRVRPAEALHYE